jgi:hypothetical protein
MKTLFLTISVLCLLAAVYWFGFTPLSESSNLIEGLLSTTFCAVFLGGFLRLKKLEKQK